MCVGLGSLHEQPLEKSLEFVAVCTAQALESHTKKKNADPAATNNVDVLFIPDFPSAKKILFDLCTTPPSNHAKLPLPRVWRSVC